MTQKPKQRKGFACLSPEQRKAVSRLGGLRAAALGTAHRWDSIAASLAGRKGGGKRWLNRPNRVA